MRKCKRVGMAAGLLMMVCVTAGADAPGLTADVRYRIESVADDAFSESALASTLRLRLGYLTPEWRNWQAFVEFEDIRTIGASDYNSTANNKARYPVVADPKDTELNQAYVNRSLGEGFMRIGRQRINVANQRFIGAVGFRQNEQTFDAALWSLPVADGRLQAAFIDRVNRVFGGHHPDPALADTDTRTYVLDYERDLGGVTAAAYMHFIELPDTPLASHRNTGVRANARHGRFDWRAEYAQQADHRDAAGIVDADYYRLDAGWDFGTFRLGVLREVLGGDGTYAFQTPFATLHAFNGAADKFLATPVNGLIDDGLQLTGRRGEWQYGASWHRFRSDAGSIDYGSETGAFIAHPLGKHMSCRLEVADYSADGFAADTRKAWFTLQAKF